MQRARPPSTSISCAPMRGTSGRPHARAAVAGYPEWMSGVAVIRMLMTSSLVELVAGVHLVEQRVHPLADVVDVVLIESGGAAKSANCGGHGGAG